MSVLLRLSLCLFLLMAGNMFTFFNFNKIKIALKKKKKRYTGAV